MNARLRAAVMAAPLPIEAFLTLLAILAELDSLRAELAILRAWQRRQRYRWN